MKKGPAPATQGRAPYCWQQQGLPGATLRYAKNSPVSLYWFLPYNMALSGNFVKRYDGCQQTVAAAIDNFAGVP